MVSIWSIVANIYLYYQTPSIYATDRDIGTNADIIYDIEAGHPFRIDIYTGFIYTSSVGVLDRENRDFYNITVHARDGGGRETVGLLQITITDVNDNKPSINEDTLDLAKTIPENYAVGGNIANITASDPDLGVNSQLLYSLTGGEGYFQVDANTGNVTLAQSLLSIERRSDFILTVRVNDGGIPSLSDYVSFHVSVTDINDNPPIFVHPAATFSQPENVQPSIILPLSPGLWTPGTVTDADYGINAQYEFYLANDSSSVFSFDNSTGILQLVQSLDYENQTLHTGSIYVKDRGNPSLQATHTLSVRLIVTDFNDQPPVFDKSYYAANVSEFTQSNVPLLLISATDADTGKWYCCNYSFIAILAPNANITFHLLVDDSNDLFRVDATSGLILTNSYLDEPTKGCYTLIVEARNQYLDGPILTDNATVYICVTDQNQSPLFSQAFYNFAVNESETESNWVIDWLLVNNCNVVQILGTVSAVDPDEGTNAIIVYKLITDPNDVGFFGINSTTVN